MVQTERNQEKMVVNKICFYGQTKWKIKVGVTKVQPDGPDKKEIRKRGYPKILLHSGLGFHCPWVHWGNTKATHAGPGQLGSDLNKLGYHEQGVNRPLR